MDQHIDNDFVFKFKLDNSDEPPIYQDPFTEMVRCQIEALLNIVILTNREKNVSVDGFKFINEQDRIYKIFRKEPEAT